MENDNVSVKKEALQSLIQLVRQIQAESIGQEEEVSENPEAPVEPGAEVPESPEAPVEPEASSPFPSDEERLMRNRPSSFRK